MGAPAGFTFHDLLKTQAFALDQARRVAICENKTMCAVGATQTGR